jgi:hypothetical protein
MAYKKKSVAITCAANAGTGTIALGAAYAKVESITAFGGTGTVVIAVTDADGVIHMTTGAVDCLGAYGSENTFGQSSTGTAPLALDGMLKDGTVATDQGGGGFIAKSPLTIDLSSATGATDAITVQVLVSV